MHCRGYCCPHRCSHGRLQSMLYGVSKGFCITSPLRGRLGWVGFDRDMGATNTLAADSAGAAMDATAAAMEEIELRSRDPLREYRIWNKARLPRPIFCFCFFFMLNIS